MQLPTETTALLLTRSDQSSLVERGCLGEPHRLDGHAGVPAQCLQERQLTRSEPPARAGDHLDGADLGVTRDQRSLGSLSGAGRAVLGAVAEGGDAHPGHPERDRDGPGDGGEDLFGRRSPVGTRGQPGQGGVRVGPVTVHHAVDEPLQPRAERKHGQGCGRRDDPGSEGRELGTHRREQADHHGVPGRDEDDQDRIDEGVRHHDGDSLEPTPEDRGDQYDGQECRGSNVEDVGHRRPDRAPRDHRDNEDTQREEQGHHPGALPRVGTHQPDHDRQKDDEEWHLQQPLPRGEGVGPVSREHPDRVRRGVEPGRPVGVGGGCRSTHEHPGQHQEDLRGDQERHRKPPCPRGKPTVGQQQERQHGARDEQRGEPVDVPDRPAVTRAGEARPHLGQRGSGEDRGHGQDEPPDRVPRTRRREHRSGHSPQRRQQCGLPADLAAGLEPDRQSCEPGRRGHPGHCPCKERRPPRGPPAKRHGVSMRRATGHAADAGARLPARSSPRTAAGAARGDPTSAAGSPRPGTRSPARRAPSGTRPSARQRP